MPLARPTGMVRYITILMLAITTLAGCRQNPEESAVSQPAPPPAAALAARSRSLDESLRDLEKEISGAIGSGLDGDAERQILRAEAITDRLLETQLPFTWLTATSYSLEAYVRQIQSLADRVVAQMRSGVDRGILMQDVMELRRKVISLRRTLALGGGNPPQSLDSLLAGYAADSARISDHGE